MALRESEAERLRRCRLIFERGVSDRLSMKDAARALELDAIAERDRLIAERRGTPAPRPAPAPEPAAEPQPPLWYQQGSYA